MNENNMSHHPPSIKEGYSHVMSYYARTIHTPFTIVHDPIDKVPMREVLKYRMFINIEISSMASQK